MVEPRQTFSFTFPSRPVDVVDGYKSKTQDVQLVTNHLKITLDERVSHIYLWAFTIEPRIEQDHRKLRNEIIESVNKQLSEELGLFLNTGYQIFSTLRTPKSSKFQIDDIRVKSGEKYKVTVEKKKEYKISDLWNTQEQRLQNEVLRWFNLQYKNFLRDLGYTELGRLSRFYNKSLEKKIQGQKLSLLPGFETAMNIYNKTLFLRCDTSNKLLANESIVEQIDSLYKTTMRDSSKDEKRAKVRQLFEGRRVLANYGNFKYYKVESIDFDRGDIKEFIPEGIETSIYDYYKKRYDISLKNLKQPLLAVITDEKLKKIGYLPSELCYMTGMPEDVNESARREILRAGQKQPQEKIKAIEDLMSQIKNKGNYKEYQEKAGINLAKDAHRFTGKRLQHPTIRFNKNFNDKIDTEQQVGFFNMKQEKFYRSHESNKQVNFAIAYFSSLEIDKFLENLRKVVEGFEYKVQKPKVIQIREQGRLLQELQQALEDPRNGIDANLDVLLILVPSRMKKDYAQIKQRYTRHLPIAVQWCIIDTITRAKGGPLSIISKLVQQMASKTGGQPWIVEPRCKVKEPLMLIGATVDKDKELKGKTVASFVATRDDNFSLYYSDYFIQDNGTDTIEKIEQLVQKAIQSFKDRNQVAPFDIIFLREGVTPSSQRQFVEVELPQILQAFNKACPNARLAIALVDKRPTQKFYQDRNGRIENAPFGTIIDSVIANEHFEFKMIAQHRCPGSATPIQYTFVHNTTKFSQDFFYDFLNAQCFNYSNWGGPIRVPAALQLATKQAQLVANSIHAEMADERLKTRLWYM